MTEIPPGNHTGTVTATGWRRENHTVESRFTYATDEGKLNVLFNWKHKRQFFQRKRLFTIIVIPGFGPGWNNKWGVFRFVAGATQIKFSCQVMDDHNGSATYGLKPEFIDMMDDFFAHQTDFVFEVHGPDGLVFALPMTNAPARYVELSDAIKRSLE
jgi:hypothetical protein